MDQESDLYSFGGHHVARWAHARVLKNWYDIDNTRSGLLPCFPAALFDLVSRPCQGGQDTLHDKDG
jgi:hypothetical protein